MFNYHRSAVFAALLACITIVADAPAATISFSNTDFTTTPTFSNVTTFSFSIDIAGSLAAGVYNNPQLNSVVYSVFGQLAAGTPSGFAAFNLQRTISGDDFYTQGSFLRFEIAAGANLGDGLQVSELVGADPIFTFDGREVGTGRYHPALFQLNADGTGSIRNSNNSGGINPGSMQVVDVGFGEEYITELAFVPTQLTVAAPVPLPPALLLLAAACGAAGAFSRRALPPHK